jgi:hypothetical protein
MVQLVLANGIGLSKSSTFKTRKLCQYHAVSYLIQNALVIYYFLFLPFLDGMLCHTMPLLATPFIKECIISNLQKAMQDI